MAMQRPSCVIVSLLTACILTGTTSAYFVDPGDVIVGLGSLRPYHFQGQSAAFGSPLDFIYGTNLNLMLAPDENDLYLCDVPVIHAMDDKKNGTTNPQQQPFNNMTKTLDDDAYESGTNSFTASNTTAARNNTSNSETAGHAYQSLLSPLHPPNMFPLENREITLLVPYGKCLPEQKASVAWRLQQDYPQFGRVSRIIIYNTDKERMDDLMTLTASKEWRIDGRGSASSNNGDSYPENSSETYNNNNNNNNTSQTLGVVFVSTRTAEIILSRLQDEIFFVQPEYSPHFGQESNKHWYFPVSFLPTRPGGQYGYYNDDQLTPNNNEDNADYHPDVYNYPQESEGGGGSQMESDFYWFRLVVFSLLVTSPCIRAAYLWYAGGARIRLRYDEQGRFVGLRYIPPTRYWFGPRPDDGYPVTASRMTREEVLALPEIIYHVEQPEENNHGGSDTLAETTTTTMTATSSNPPDQPIGEQQRPQLSDCDHGNGNVAGDLEESNVVVDAARDNNDDARQRSRKSSTASEESSTTTSESDDDQPSTPEPAASQATPLRDTSELQELHQFEGCTTCSICIDDFEEGERLRLLPRCRHVFHTACIMPWLTERQGCCPLCKTPVIESEGDEDSVAGEPPIHLALSDSDSGIEMTNDGPETDSDGGNNPTALGANEEGVAPQQHDGDESDLEAQLPVVIIEDETSEYTNPTNQR